MAEPRVTIEIDNSQLIETEKKLKSILKLIIQINAIARKNWVLRLFFGLKRGKNEKQVHKSSKGSNR